MWLQEIEHLRGALATFQEKLPPLPLPIHIEPPPDLPKDWHEPASGSEDARVVTMSGRETNRRLAVCAIVALLTACGPTDEQRKREEASAAQQAAQKAEEELLADPSRAAVELERRLSASIKVENGLLFVRDENYGFLGSFVLPVDTPWVLRCGLDLSVSFGDTSGGEESFTDDATVHLALGLDEQRCDTLAPLLGKRVQEILSAGSSQ